MVSAVSVVVVESVFSYRSGWARSSKIRDKSRYATGLIIACVRGQGIPLDKPRVELTGSDWETVVRMDILLTDWVSFILFYFILIQSFLGFFFLFSIEPL